MAEMITVSEGLAAISNPVAPKIGVAADGTIGPLSPRSTLVAICRGVAS